MRDGVARSVDRREPGEERPDGLGHPQDPYGDLHRDPERPLGADEHAEQVGALVIARERHELAVGEDDVGCEYVVDREAVLEAVSAAGVLGDVAPDRADLLTGGIGRVVEALACDGLRDLQVGHARLDDDPTAVEVDLEDAVEPRERDDDPVGDRQRATREPRAGATRDERDAVQVAGADDRLHLGRRAGNDDELGHGPVTRQRIALVRPERRRLRDQRARGELPGELGSKRIGKRHPGTILVRFRAPCPCRPPLLCPRPPAAAPGRPPDPGRGLFSRGLFKRQVPRTRGPTGLDARTLSHLAQPVKRRASAAGRGEMLVVG